MKTGKAVLRQIESVGDIQFRRSCRHSGKQVESSMVHLRKHKKTCLSVVCGKVIEV